MNDTELTHADVERIVKLADEGGFELVRLKSGELEVILVRSGYVEQDGHAPATSSSGISDSPRDTGTAAPRTRPAPATPPGPQTATPSAAPPGEVGGGTSVVSPMVGIVYLTPDPDSAPYVEAGQLVEAGATVALVEVMKMFTAVQADVSGRVAEVFVESGQQVDRGQPLFRLEG